ncbi:MAG: Hpt domain-containing protein [Pseudohongiella sp.]|nr:Hpt domain-containing protein [Pseudohongiella sp.]
MDDDKRIEIRQKLQAIHEEYAKALPGKIQEIESVFNSAVHGDGKHEAITILHRLLHTIAGSAGTHGFPESSKAAREMEIILKPALDDEQLFDNEMTIELRKSLDGLRDFNQ